MSQELASWSFKKKASEISFFTLKSQSHRIIKVRRKFLSSSSPASLLQVGAAISGFLGLSSWIFNISQLGTTQVSCSTVWLPSEYKKVFLVFRWNFLIFNLCPLPLVLIVATTEKSLVPSSSFSPKRYLLLIYTDEINPEPSHPSSLSLSPFERCSSISSSSLLFAGLAPVS